jgi:hypothetical protein
MATTKLLSKTVGDVTLQSGSGTPDHVALIGSLYSNTLTGNIWLNVDGSTGWEQLQRSAHGEMGLTATTTLSPSTTTFTALTSNWLLRVGNGISVVGGKLRVGTGRAGRYCANGVLSIQRNATSTSYQVAIVKNVVTPIIGEFQQTAVDATTTIQNIAVEVFFDLVVGDDISFGIKAGAAGNVNILYGELSIYRIAE